ncbi:MAG: molybdopterin-dependent oxidoreductase [Aestuariivirga sp.]|uniref:molybdopterin-dependent oxidoreductase n=1 Tax=Aestuariivirga sp. TaxID=2650926 RepID=UPI003019DA6C
MRLVVAAAAVVIQLLVVGTAGACTLPQPKGDVILSIDGMINDCNEGLEVHLDRAMIDALPLKQIKTENPWDHGLTTYEGVLLRDLMKYVKADGKTATFTALNDYRSDLPLADVEKYDVILAFKRDGADLSVREKGPFFVVFPFTDVPELATEARYAQSVWQVNRISVK